MRSPLETGDELEIVAATRELAVVKHERRKQSLRAGAIRIALPPDYKFDREEANER